MIPYCSHADRTQEPTRRARRPLARSCHPRTASTACLRACRGRPEHRLGGAHPGLRRSGRQPLDQPRPARGRPGAAREAHPGPSAEPGRSSGRPDPRADPADPGQLLGLRLGAVDPGDGRPRDRARLRCGALGAGGRPDHAPPDGADPAAPGAPGLRVRRGVGPAVDRGGVPAHPGARRQARGDDLLRRRGGDELGLPLGHHLGAQGADAGGGGDRPADEDQPRLGDQPGRGSCAGWRWTAR